ncbi:MAG: dCTP deaminase [Acidilobaceae archaeon]
MILSDRDIFLLIRAGDLKVEPFSSEIVRENGLDLRLGRGFCRFKATSKVLDPRNPGDPSEFYECSEGEEILIGPKEHVLLHTLEYVKLPDYVAGLVNLRSTWARTGIYVPSTAADAGFEGQLTIEVIGSSFPVKLYAGDRFLHLLLVKLGTPSIKPYRGEYQGQTGVKLPKFFSKL